MDYKLRLALDACADEQFEDAHHLLVDCLDSAANAKDGTTYATALLALGDNLFAWCPANSDPFEGRRAAAEEALSVFRRIGDACGEARALLALSRADHVQSNELADAAFEIASKLGETAVMADVMCHRGCCDLTERRIDSAIAKLTKAVRLAEQCGDADLLARVLFALGTAEDNAPRRAAAFERMAALEQSVRRKRRFANQLCVAASSVHSHDPVRAASWHARCLSVARELADAQLEGSILYALAQIERSKGNLEKAAELHSLASVLCPPADITPLVNAADDADPRAMEAAIRAVFFKAKEDS